jgi:hypothetical protein
MKQVEGIGIANVKEQRVDRPHSERQNYKTLREAYFYMNSQAPTAKEACARREHSLIFTERKNTRE